MVDRDTEVRALYDDFLRQWNRRDAAAMAKLFAPDGGLIGFDGSEVDGGPAGVEAHLSPIFKSHKTAAYVSIVRSVRFPTADVAILRAVVGMVPPDGDDINPAVNAVQVVVAERAGDAWRIASAQTTPAAFHGRPDAVEALTDELRGALRAGALHR